MVAIARTGCLDGFTALPVDVQVDAGHGLPVFSIVGLTDRAIQEARERVRSAIRNSHLKFPEHRVTVNLAPAEMRKEGSAFDLAIAVAIVRAGGRDINLDGAFIGELGLDGSVRRTRGVLPMCLRLAADGVGPIYVPRGNFAEASASGAEVQAVDSLAQLVDHLAVGGAGLPAPPPIEADPSRPPMVDLAEIQAQAVPKRALEIAAAGGHHLLLAGPPGAGKSLLARALVGLLPDLDVAAAKEVTTIHSVGGLLNRPGLLWRPPMRSPHHTVSIAGLIGGRNTGVAGELSLAHRGVLVLDELPEFSRNCLEALREPLEEGQLRISRASGTRLVPASFVLAATANPCPCGRATAAGEDPCSCAPDVVARYQRRISGPLRDRIDLVLEVRPVRLQHGPGRREGESSAEVAARVCRAREIQATRQGRRLNAALSPAELGEVCDLDRGATRLVPRLAAQHQLTGRGFHGVFRLARTIADLAGRRQVTAADMLEAGELRGA